MKISRKLFLKWGLVALLGLLLTALGRLFAHTLFTKYGDEKIEEGLEKEQKAREEKLSARKIKNKEEQEKEEEGNKVYEDRLTGWQRKLGKTGEQVSLLGLGGAGIIARADKSGEAVETVKRAVELGINYIDTAPTYGDGTSEKHIGEAVKPHRRKVFLATKTLDRSYDGTMKLIEKSLERLQTDYIDLYQLHGLEDNEDVKKAFDSHGAVQALLKLKEEGVVKFIGITGHRKPEPLQWALKHENFDCILIPLNPAEVHFQSFQKGMLELALEKKVGIVAMKVAAYGRLFRQEGINSMSQAFKYTASLPISTAVVGVSSLRELEENAAICRDFTPLRSEQMEELEKMTKPYQEEANFYKLEW